MKALNKEILRLALPSILANITVPLVGMVDLAVAGHLDASAAALIGGISVGSLMFDILYWNFGFLRAGTGGMTAQAFGRKDWRACGAILRRGVLTALALALLIILVQWPFQKLAFLCIQSSPEVKELALKYFYVRVWAAPATLTLMTVRGWFIGMQDTFSSMLTDLVVNGANIFASIFLAFGVPGTSFRGIGFYGIALGTVIAQYAGLLFASGILFRKYGGTLQQAGNERTSRASLRESMSVNRDLFIRSLCLMAVYLAFMAISARFGDVLLAACSIMMKLMMIFSYFTDGFAFAGEALTGRYVGAEDIDNVKGTVKWTFVWSMGIGMFFVAIYMLTGIPMFRLMTSDASVIEAAREFIPWLVIMPLVGCPAFTWDGIYIGATATRAMRNSNIGCIVAFFAVWYAGIFVLAPAGSGRVHLLFAAYYAHLIYRSAYQTLEYKSSILSRKRTS